MNGLYSDNEETYDQQEDDETIRGFDYDQFEPPKLQKPKNLLEQIRELSPELKMLIFDRGLARKDYDFKSKKDWIRIPL